MLNFTGINTLYVSAVCVACLPGITLNFLIMLVSYQFCSNQENKGSSQYKRLLAFNAYLNLMSTLSTLIAFPVLFWIITSPTDTAIDRITPDYCKAYHGFIFFANSAQLIAVNFPLLECYLYRPPNPQMFKVNHQYVAMTMISILVTVGTVAAVMIPNIPSKPSDDRYCTVGGSYSFSFHSFNPLLIGMILFILAVLVTFAGLLAGILRRESRKRSAVKPLTAAGGGQRKLSSVLIVRANIMLGKKKIISKVVIAQMTVSIVFTIPWLLLYANEVIPSEISFKLILFLMLIGRSIDPLIVFIFIDHYSATLQDWVNGYPADLREDHTSGYYYVSAFRFLTRIYKGMRITTEEEQQQQNVQGRQVGGEGDPNETNIGRASLSTSNGPPIPAPQSSTPPAGAAAQRIQSIPTIQIDE